MGKSRTGMIATACTGVGSLFGLIAFATPYWLVNDGKQERAIFNNIGLWEVCFSDYEDYRHYYDTKFNGCKWMFREDFQPIREFRLNGALRATQFFFTICWTLLLIGGFMTALYTCCSRQHPRYVELLLAIGSILTLSGLCGVLSGLIFGLGGDVRDWLPDWEHNHLGYSYVLADLASLLLLTAGVLFLIEGRRYKKRNERMMDDDSKTHTNI